jgi:hypothetical protein
MISAYCRWGDEPPGPAGFALLPMLVAILLLLCSVGATLVALPDAISIFRNARSFCMIRTPVAIADARSMRVASFVQVMKYELGVQPTISGFPTFKPSRKILVGLYMEELLPLDAFAGLYGELRISERLGAWQHDSVRLVGLSNGQMEFPPPRPGNSPPIISIFQVPSKSRSLGYGQNLGLTWVFRQFQDGLVGFGEGPLGGLIHSVIHRCVPYKDQQGENFNAKSDALPTLLFLTLGCLLLTFGWWNVNYNMNCPVWIGFLITLSGCVPIFIGVSLWLHEICL